MLATKLKVVLSLAVTLTLLAAGVCTLARPTAAGRCREPSGTSSLVRLGSPELPQGPQPAADADRAVQTDDAIAAGLQWLVRQQAHDGRWSFDGSYKNDVAATAFGLLPLLEAGHTHKKTDAFHPYARRVERGLQFLLRAQKEDGEFPAGMYPHGLATRALCEAYRLTSDPALKAPAQKALDYIVAAQHEQGGWRYQPRSPGDTSVTSYMVIALARGRAAGLKVPEKTLTLAGQFLDSVATGDGSAYSYIPGSPGTATMTAAGLLCRLELGGKPGDKALARWAGSLRQQGTVPADNLYMAYYVTRTVERRGGADWELWEPRMRKAILDRQDKGAKLPGHKGSWPPDGTPYAQATGRIMTTSLALLTLQACARADKPVAGPARDLKGAELTALYDALGDEDFVVARRAVRALTGSPRLSVPFLKALLHPAPPVDTRRIEKLIADLDDTKFTVRDRATAELEKLGELAHPALRKALEGKPNVEVRRRIEQVLEATTRDEGTPEQRRGVRAVEVLVGVGGPEARRVLEALAAGAPESRLTQAAKSGLARMDGRAAP